MKKQMIAAILATLLGLMQPGLVRAQGQQEGIKVHGHWAIDVRQPDGTLVTHREFENALLPGPDLAKWLGKVSVPGNWSLQIGGPPVPYGAGGPCSISTFGICSVRNVAVNVPEAGNQLILNGTVTAGVNGQIARVWSGIGSCEPSVLVGDCTATYGGGGVFVGNFTYALLASPIPVVSGQIVQVTVVISFS